MLYLHPIGGAGAGVAMTDAVDFLVDRSDLRRTAFRPGRHGPDSALESGQVLVRIDRFTFTANNVTYGAVADLIGYWNFFPAEEGWGRIPVWGFGDVVRSRHDAVPAGERLYGYFPMSTHVVLQADCVSATGLVDASAHRAALPPFYNQYSRVAADPGYDTAREGEIALFPPLFATSFLVDDFLADRGFFDARAAVLSSASSKTALGSPSSCRRRGASSAESPGSPHPPTPPSWRAPATTTRCSATTRSPRFLARRRRSLWTSPGTGAS